MAATDVSKHGMWSSQWLFVLAAAGSAVGLGNIWKFPYMAGQNGGGAFVVVYLLCVALIGIPIMMSEVLLGREGRLSPINTMRSLVLKAKGSPLWVIVGWMGVLAGFLILSYYSMIAGWAFHYVLRLADGTFTGADGEFASQAFESFLAQPWQMIFWHTLFMAVTIFIVARGVSRGLEVAIKIFMPTLFVLMIVLVGYSMTSGGFAEGFAFMFNFDWARLSVDGVLQAMGHAFFTLSLGMGAIMAYGAYMPGSASIAKTVVAIAVLDTLVALAAGLVIFPIVFANGLEPGQGPGLMFVTMPLAFGQMPLGTLFGTAFFVLVSFAAITSAISLLEPALAFLVEQYNAQRHRAAISLGVFCWVLGLGSVFSFNYWKDFHIVDDLNFFSFVDYLSANIMLPVGGFLIVLFVGWVVPRTIVVEQMSLSRGFRNVAWQLLVRVVAPVGVLVVFGYQIYGSLN